MIFDLGGRDAAQEDPDVARSMPKSFSFGGSPGSNFSMSKTLSIAPANELNLSPRLGSTPGFDFDPGLGFPKSAQTEDGAGPNSGFQVTFCVPQPQQPQLRVRAHSMPLGACFNGRSSGLV